MLRYIFLIPLLAWASLGVSAQTHHAAIPDDNGPWQTCNIQIEARDSMLDLRQVPVARTDRQRAAGLREHNSKRPALMLFYWPRPDKHAFWMKDVPHPLAIGFINPQSRLVDIQFMEPNTTRPHTPTQAVTMALETPPELLKDIHNGSRLQITDCHMPNAS